MKGARLLIATQYGWHGVDNSHRLPWHCGVICSPEIRGGIRGYRCVRSFNFSKTNSCLIFAS